MVHDDENEFYYVEEGIILTDVDSFISKVKTYMVQEMPDDDFRMYIGIDEKQKCFQLWFKDSEGHMYMVKTDMVDEKEIDQLDDKENLT